MKIIDRYMTGQVLTTGTFAVIVLSVVLVLGNVFTKLLNLLVNHDAPFELVLSVIAYIIPFSLSFTIPWGLLTAVLLVYGKMSAENELIALRSSGISIPRISIFVFMVAAGCVGCCLWINNVVAPHAQQQMKDAIYNIATNNPLSLFGSDRVIDEFPGKKIYVEENQGAQLKNLLIYEMNDDSVPMTVFHAASGWLEADPQKLEILLHIYNARYEKRDTSAPTNIEKIQDGNTIEEMTLPISLQELYDKNKKKKSMSQLATQELLEDWSTKTGTPQQMAQYRANALTELNKRSSISLAPLAFVLIGIPLAITAHRKETSIGFLLSVIIAFVYFCFILIADTMRSKPAAHPELLVWSPNLIFIGLGLYLFYKLARR